MNSIESHIENLPIPPLINIDELEISFEDGIPKYKDTNAFIQAKNVIYRISNNQYLEWTRRIGLNLLYKKYIYLSDRIEANVEIPAFDLIPADEREFILLPVDGGIFLDPSLPFPKLTNEDSRMIIGDDIHAFTPQFHVVIDGGTISQLEEVLSDPRHDPDNGILLEFTKDYQEFYEDSRPNEPKVAYDLISCPNNFVDSFDPLREIPDNVRIVSTPGWSPGNYQAFRHKYDEQRDI